MPVHKHPDYIQHAKPWDECQADIDQTGKDLEKISCKCKDGFPAVSSAIVTYSNLMTEVTNITTNADANTVSIGEITTGNET